MKLICGEKTVQSLPKFNFIEDLSLSAFLKHYSNISESIKLIKEIIFYRWISMYDVFPTRASVFLTSLTKFGGKKMRGSRRERCFYSNYFIPKCNCNEESFFSYSTTKQQKKLLFLFFTFFKFLFISYIL